MRLLACVLLGLLPVLMPTLAAAQGQGMMDPRQMSGAARPDEQVAPGALTIRVLAGELAAWAPVGTLVHLVGLHGDRVSLQTEKVNDEGRAEFKGLVTDGLAAYYALSVYGGDRLVGQPVTPLPGVGTRMMLTGRKLDASGQPVGPAIDDEHQGHEGVAEAPRLPPAGEVEVLVRGRVEPGATAVLRELVTGTTREARLDGSSGALSTRFTGVEGGPERVYLAEVAAQEGGKTHRSTPFQLTTDAGARRMVLVYDDLLFAMHGGGQPDEQRMWFEMTVTVANLGGSPIDVGPEGLLLPLPQGFRSASIPEESGMMFSLVPGKGLLRKGAVPPGQLTGVVQFALGADGGRVMFDMPAPIGMFQSQVAIVKAPGMVTNPSAGALAAPELRRAEDGREYYILSGFTVPPGESLRFEIAGLPTPAKWQGWVKALAGAVAILLVGLAVAVAVRQPRVVAAPRDPAAIEKAKRDLGARREKLYDELVALERARAAQRIEEGAFSAHRKTIMAKLVLVHRQLDDLDAPPSGGAQGKQAQTS
jgi:hypothetical protein